MVGLFLVSCGSDDNRSVAESPPTLTREDLVGTWEQTSLKITYNQELGIDDSVSVFEVDEGEWLRILSVPPVRTMFYGDSTFQHLFRDINGDMMDQQRGLWNLIGDTLILITPDATYVYDIEVGNNGKSQYQSILDWDGDGVEDDGYEATHRLISRSTQ
jgi:hypothetical protein